VKKNNEKIDDIKIKLKNKNKKRKKKKMKHQETSMKKFIQR